MDESRSRERRALRYETVLVRWVLSQTENSLLTSVAAALEPNFLLLLVQLIAKLRWDDTTNLPLPRVINISDEFRVLKIDD